MNLPLRKVPNVDYVIWSIEEQYDSGVMVSDNQDTGSYTLYLSKRLVPRGVRLDDKRFWRKVVVDEGGDIIELVDELENRIGTNESDISDLKGKVSDSESSITSLQSRVATNEGDISELQNINMSQYPAVWGSPQEYEWDKTDLNNYINYGVYYIPTDYGAANVPSGTNGWLVVITDIPSNDEADIIKQVFYRTGNYSETNDGTNMYTFVRTSIDQGATWSGWKQYAMISDIEELESKIDSIEPFTGTNISTAGTDCNDYTKSGVYYFTTANNPDNSPQDGINGWLIVLTIGSSNVQQIWIRNGLNNLNDKQVYKRRYNSDEGWGNWLRYLHEDDLDYYPDVTVVSESGTDLNDYHLYGVYVFSSSVTPINIPSGVNGWLIVLPATHGSTTQNTKQLFIKNGSLDSNDWNTYVRTCQSGTWSSWKRYAVTDDIDSALTSYPVFKNVTTSGTDLNDYYDFGVYFFSSSTYTPDNIPSGVNGWLIVLPISGQGGKQIWMRYGTIGSNDHATYIRTYSTQNGAWGDWYEIASSQNIGAGAFFKYVAINGDTFDLANGSSTSGTIDVTQEDWRPIGLTGWRIANDTSGSGCTRLVPYRMTLSSNTVTWGCANYSGADVTNVYVQVQILYASYPPSW